MVSPTHPLWREFACSCNEGHRHESLRRVYVRISENIPFIYQARAAQAKPCTTATADMRRARQNSTKIPETPRCEIYSKRILCRKAASLRVGISRKAANRTALLLHPVVMDRSFLGSSANHALLAARIGEHTHGLPIHDALAVEAISLSSRERERGSGLTSVCCGGSTHSPKKFQF